MSGGSQNTVSQQTVPSWLQPYFQGALSQGQDYLNKPGPEYYPGQQVAPLQPMQQAGLQSIANTAGAPNASQAAQRANEFETSGALLNPEMNPWLRGTFQQGANAIQNQLSTEFAGNGSNIINSLPVQSDEMNQLATQLYGGAYNQGLQYMTGAQALAPGLDQSSYLPGQELMQAGGTSQEQLQNQINAAMQQWNYNQTLPYNKLSWYSNLLGQNASPFQSASSVSTMNNNQGTSALGGAAAGAALGTEVMPGWGTAGGALIGGLLGYLG